MCITNKEPDKNRAQVSLPLLLGFGFWVLGLRSPATNTLISLLSVLLFSSPPLFLLPIYAFNLQLQRHYNINALKLEMLILSRILKEKRKIKAPLRLLIFAFKDNVLSLFLTLSSPFLLHLVVYLYYIKDLYTKSSILYNLQRLVHHFLIVCAFLCSFFFLKPYLFSLIYLNPVGKSKAITTLHTCEWKANKFHLVLLPENRK